MTRTDREHLQTLSVCHYVLSGLCFVFGCFPILHLVVGIAIVTEAIGPPPKQQGNAPFPLELMGWFFIGVASIVIVLYWSLAVALYAAGNCLRRRARHTFCLIVAGAACLFQPLGMVLAVFTFIVLLRPGVRAAFEPVRDERPERDADYPE